MAADSLSNLSEDVLGLCLSFLLPGGQGAVIYGCDVDAAHPRSPIAVACSAMRVRPTSRRFARMLPRLEGLGFTLKGAPTIGHGVGCVEAFWTDEAWDLSPGSPALMLSYDVLPLDADSECIGAWSASGRLWHEPGPKDALSWYAASHRGDFGFRTQLFGAFPAQHAYAQHNTSRIQQGEWCRVDVLMMCPAVVEGQAPLIVAKYCLNFNAAASFVVDPGHDGVPHLGGRMGLVSYKHTPSHSYSGAYRFRNFEVRRAPSAQEPCLWPLPAARYA